MDQSEDYAQNQVPNVFVEQTQPVAEHGRSGVRRGQLMVVCLMLAGALVASTVGMLMLRNSEQTQWARKEQQLQTERNAAVERAGRLDVASTRLAADLEQAKAKVEKYGAIEYQLNLIREKAQQIEDLRRAKPSYPHDLYMDTTSVPEWSAPGERLLKDFVSRLDAERNRLIAFREPRPPSSGPAMPEITPAPRTAEQR